MPLDLEMELIESARAGAAGLERLMAAVWPEAYRVAFSVLRDNGLAEDAAQEACATIARSLASLKDAAVFRAWSYRIVVNHAISVARGRPHTQTLDALIQRGVHFDHSDALDLYRALGALPPIQRGAILLHYYAGLNSGEIAAATGLPPSTVRFHIMLARRTLRKALSAAEERIPQLPTEAMSDVH